MAFVFGKLPFSLLYQFVFPSYVHTIGYFHKPQPVGRYELERCTRTMGLLRPQLEPNVPAVQLAQVTNRMLSDLECRGTMRTAPETCNLNAYLDDKDVLATEFMRTYRSVVFPGGAFVYRLEMELASRTRGAPEQKRMRSAPIPVSKRVNPKSPKVQRPDVDIYGYRGADPRIYYLSPWEFRSLWDAEVLLPPCSQGHEIRTYWLEGGLEYYNLHKHDVKEATLQPGVHYKVLERIAGIPTCICPHSVCLHIVPSCMSSCLDFRVPLRLCVRLFLRSSL